MAQRKPENEAIPRGFPRSCLDCRLKAMASLLYKSARSQGSKGASGSRDIIILTSACSLEDSNVVPRCSIRLTEDDQRKLGSQGIPSDCCDDLSIIRARIKLDKECEVVSVGRGEELSRDDVLRQLEHVMKTTNKDGVVIYYFGNGKRNTGDWCLRDGFVAFKDITELYMEHFREHVFTIITDCSHSGHWVKACKQFLDEQEVRPCGHSAVEKGILLNVYASCKADEVAATPCFAVRGMNNDKNNGYMTFNLDIELRATQHSYGGNYTRLRCGKAIDEPCALTLNYTWQRKSESERIFLVRGKDHGRPAWHYVLLVDDEETIRIFKEKTQGEAAGKESVDVANYGQILKSGWGNDPPNDVRDAIEGKYESVYS